MTRLIHSFYLGFIPIVIENIFDGDELVTDINKIEEEILSHKPESIACILSTTSCFAPRGYDKYVIILYFLILRFLRTILRSLYFPIL
jgi:hypothetical protein